MPLSMKALLLVVVLLLVGGEGGAALTGNPQARANRGSLTGKSFPDCQPRFGTRVAKIQSSPLLLLDQRDIDQCRGD